MSYTYLLFYKPDEVLSQFSDSGERKTLKHYIPITGVYAAGRLDYHSEGLLILSDDKLFIHKLTEPKFNHQKKYLAQLEGIISDEAIAMMSSQIVLHGIQTKLPFVERVLEPDLPDRPRPVRPYHPTSWIKITLAEGKKHQVRRMTAAVGYPTLRLIRIEIENITLDRLAPGEWRYLTEQELRNLFSKLRLSYSTHN